MGINERINEALQRGATLADEYRERKEAERRRAYHKWTAASFQRHHENGLNNLLGFKSGRFDDTYEATIPLNIGWNSHEDGASLAFVSLGGVDVSAYLPPEVLQDIKDHIASEWDMEEDQ